MGLGLSTTFISFCSTPKEFYEIEIWNAITSFHLEIYVPKMHKHKSISAYTAVMNRESHREKKNDGRHSNFQDDRKHTEESETFKVDQSISHLAMKLHCTHFVVLILLCNSRDGRRLQLGWVLQRCVVRLHILWLQHIGGRHGKLQNSQEPATKFHSNVHKCSKSPFSINQCFWHKTHRSGVFQGYCVQFCTNQHLVATLKI